MFGIRYFCNKRRIKFELSWLHVYTQKDNSAHQNIGWLRTSTSYVPKLRSFVSNVSYLIHISSTFITETPEFRGNWRLTYLHILH